MSGKSSEEGIAGPFEDLPALLVVLVAVALFSVSLGHAYGAWKAGRDYAGLQEDCLDLTRMVLASDLISADGEPGCYDLGKLTNLTASQFSDRFNASVLGLQYTISIRCVHAGGMPGENITFKSADMPAWAETASFSTCTGLRHGDRTGAALVSVTVWRGD